MSDVQQSHFEGFALVDVLGHQRFAGHVTTRHFGTTAFFDVATPEREQREVVLEKDDYLPSHGTCAAGTKVVREGKPAVQRLIGAGSIYMLTPVTREAVLAWLDDNEPCATLSVVNPDGTPKETLDVPW